MFARHLLIASAVTLAVAGCGGLSDRMGRSTPEPLTVTSDDPYREMREAPLVEEEDGTLRREGLFHFLADESFHTGALRELGGIELLLEGDPNPLGTRIIVARTADDRLDHVIGSLRDAPGIIAGPDKNYSFRLDN